jgi:hypothetical protein
VATKKSACNLRQPEGTADLFEAVCASLTTRGFPGSVALPVAHFVFPTWFADCLPYAPFLLITGPRPEAVFLLDLLECLVRQPLALGHLTGVALIAQASKRVVTLLIDHERMSASTRDMVRASNRNVYVPSNGGLFNLCCAKVLYCGLEVHDDYRDEIALQVNVPPSRGRLPVLEDEERSSITDNLRPRLRAYRKRNFERVRASHFDLPEFSSKFRILSRILGAPLVEAPDVQAGLGPLLHQYQEETEASRWCDPCSVTIEALLYHCHQDQASKLYVGELARTATAILKGRGEQTEIGPKEVGAILRQRLSLSPKRDSRGFALPMGEPMRQRIHELAHRFDLINVAQQSGCSHCANISGGDQASPRSEGSKEAR